MTSAYIIMAYTAMIYVVMACQVMAYIVMAYISYDFGVGEGRRRRHKKIKKMLHRRVRAAESPRTPAAGPQT